MWAKISLIRSKFLENSPLSHLHNALFLSQIFFFLTWKYSKENNLWTWRRVNNGFCKLVVPTPRDWRNLCCRKYVKSTNYQSIYNKLNGPFIVLVLVNSVFMHIHMSLWKTTRSWLMDTALLSSYQLFFIYLQSDWRNMKVTS